MTLDGTNVTSNATIYPSYIEYIPVVPLSNGSHSVSLGVKSTKDFLDIENWTFSINYPGGCIGGGGSGSGGGGFPKIIFVSNRSGNFDIWIMNLNGSGLQQITYDSSNESSPAGIESKIVYVSDKSGSKDIWSMDFNASNKKQLTSSILDESIPSWSYIGGIIYTEGKYRVSNLEVMNTDGTGKTKITNGSAYTAEPACSADNEGILYSSVSNGESAIYLMNFEENGPKVKFWKLEEGYSLQIAGVDTKSAPAQAWLKLQRNGITRDDYVVRVGQAFSLSDNGRVILNAILNRISGSNLNPNSEVELVNVTQYSSINGSPLFANVTKIFVNKILLNVVPEITVSTFDTGPGTYPSISGTHNGSLTLTQNLTIHSLYTHPSAGTGGHSEYAAFYYPNGTLLASGNWTGYRSDWHNITFAPFTIEAGVTYNYTIRTGSYPQIIHSSSFSNSMGIINSTEFTDANGKRYTGWIPAIRLE